MGEWNREDALKGGTREEEPRAEPSESPREAAGTASGTAEAAEAAAASETLAEAPEEAALSEQDLNYMIEEICNSKAEEFRLLGYENVTGKDIWECVSSNYTREMPRLHRIVNDILSLRPTKFMNWLTMRMWKQSDE